MSYKVSTVIAMAKDERISLRISADDLGVLRAAAKESELSLTEFIIQTSRNRAQTILCDRTELVLDAEAFDEFTAWLEKPPEPNEALRELFARPRPQ